MKSKKLKITVSIVILLAAMASVIAVGFKYGIAPIIHLQDITTFYMDGNKSKYDTDSIEAGTSLQGKTVLFLGSSVTYGSKSMGVSFVDYIERESGCTAIKEAVSGTTLVDNGSTSYVSRLNGVDASHVDIVVCQLSTNDATKEMPLGTANQAEPDTSTVAGAIEYIIEYSKSKWNAMVVFYTNPYYDSDYYGRMVTLLNEIAEHKDILVYDMWSSESFNSISDDKRRLYMADEIHPTKAGYRDWITPYMMKTLPHEYNMSRV